MIYESGGGYGYGLKEGEVGFMEGGRVWGRDRDRDDKYDEDDTDFKENEGRKKRLHEYKEAGITRKKEEYEYAMSDGIKTEEYEMSDIFSGVIERARERARGTGKEF